MQDKLLKRLEQSLEGINYLITSHCSEKFESALSAAVDDLLAYSLSNFDVYYTFNSIHQEPMAKLLTIFLKQSIVMLTNTHGNNEAINRISRNRVLNDYFYTLYTH